jgi:GTP-binding protein
VWLVADTRISSLLAFRDHPHRRAGDGSHGQGAKRHGRNGKDLEVAVPVGTVVRSLDGEVVADLASPGHRFLAASGGRGGRGNAAFLTNRRKAPAFAEQGELGEERWYDMELKLLADVALVGMPNVGKSTLISRVSAAKPKVADYPFTTLEPHLGVVRIPRGGDEDFVIADVPGLVEGAAEGRGLGHRFLRHVERARVLLVLLDISPMAPCSHEEQEAILLRELRRYKPQLLERPRLTVGTKADIAGHELAGGSLPAELLRISAVSGEGMAELLWRLASLVRAEREKEGRRSTEVVVHRPAPEGVSVERQPDGSYLVSGRPALRALRLSDLGDEEAAVVAMARLRRLGVERALRRAGVRDGDRVVVGDVELVYRSDDLVEPLATRRRRR